MRVREEPCGGGGGGGGGGGKAGKTDLGVHAWGRNKDCDHRAADENGSSRATPKKKPAQSVMGDGPTR